MFSSEQILKISGDMSQLEESIRFAIRMSGTNPKNITYQITSDGKYCIGWGDKDGWEKYQFDFDAHIVSEIIKQHLNKTECENPYEYSDGSSSKGFLMEAIYQSFADIDNGIKNPFYGIVSIVPYYNYYAK